MYYDRSAGGIYLPTPTLYKPGMSWPSGGGDGYYFAFSDNDSDVSTSPPYTFSSKSLVKPHPTRAMILTVGWRDNSGSCDVSSVTIGGVSASFAAESVAGNQIRKISMWIARVPTGTTGDVVINFNNNTDDIGWNMITTWGISSLTPVDTAADTTVDISDELNLDLSTTGAGIAVMAGHTEDNPDHLYTAGASQLNDFQFVGNNTRAASIGADYVTTTETRTMTLGFDATPSNPQGVSAYFV